MPGPSVIVALNPGFPSSCLSLAVREIRELEGKPGFEASVVPGPHKLTAALCMSGDSQMVYAYLMLQLCVSARIKQNLYCLPMTILAGYKEGCGTILGMGKNITTSSETSVRETHPLPCLN